MVNRYPIPAWEVSEAIARTPIIAVTASVLENRRKDCFVAGMDDVLTKPFFIDSLQEKSVKWVIEDGKIE